MLSQFLLYFVDQRDAPIFYCVDQYLVLVHKLDQATVQLLVPFPFLFLLHLQASQGQFFLLGESFHQLNHEQEGRVGHGLQLSFEKRYAHGSELELSAECDCLVKSPVLNVYNEARFPFKGRLESVQEFAVESELSVNVFSSKLDTEGLDGGHQIYLCQEQFGLVEGRIDLWFEESGMQIHTLPRRFKRSRSQTYFSCHFLEADHLQCNQYQYQNRAQWFQFRNMAENRGKLISQKMIGDIKVRPTQVTGLNQKQSITITPQSTKMLVGVKRIYEQKNERVRLLREGQACAQQIYTIKNSIAEMERRRSAVKYHIHSLEIGLSTLRQEQGSTGRDKHFYEEFDSGSEDESDFYTV